MRLLVLLLCTVGSAPTIGFSFESKPTPDGMITTAEPPFYRLTDVIRPSDRRTQKWQTEGSLIREHYFDTPLTWNSENIVTEETDEEHTRYVFHRNITAKVQDKVIPELCYLTSQNITIYNSFLLDRTCLREFESVSAECRGFKCELAHWFLEHGARIFGKFFKTDTIQEAVQLVEEEVSAMFTDVKMCTCGREFFKAAFRCAPYYYANVLFAAWDNDEDDIYQQQKFMRNVDLKSLSKVVDRLLEGLCVETRSERPDVTEGEDTGLCVSSILNSVAQLGGMLETTIDDYDRYDEGDRKFQKSQEKRCDALFGPLKTWEQDNRELPDAGHENEYMEILFSKTAAVANSFYCDKSCKKTRGTFYPCCLMTILEDRKLWNNVEKVTESVFRVVPAMNYHFQYKGFYQLWGYFWYDYTEETFENWKTWTLPDNVRELFMRTINGPKYCPRKIIKCKED